MSGYLSFLRDQLVARGWPAQLIDAITRHVTSDDIVGIGIRLAIIGVLASVVRVMLYELYERGHNALYPTAYIEINDPAFDWIGTYLSQDPLVVNKQAKQGGLALSKKDATWTSDSVVGQLVPVNGQDLRITFEGRPLWVTRKSRGFERDPHSEKQHLQIRSYAWHADKIKDFVLASHKVFYQKGANELMIHDASPWNGSWFSPVTRPTRAWSSVFLPRHIKEDLHEDVRGFLSEDEKQWYATRGIPHRRGYLLHGPPGSGKTTLATAIASHLRLDLYCVNPAMRGMDDNKVQMLFRDVPSGSLILIEDIDCVMPARPRNQHEVDSDDDEAARVATKAEADPGRYGLSPSTVTLSGLLNAIDGVASQEDSVLLASTNHPERLDDALKRPGRFDVHVRFELADSKQVIGLFKHFYPVTAIPNCTETKMGTTEKATPPAVGFGTEQKQSALATELSQTIGASGAEVSMAALQGHLLKHKKNSKLAVENAGEWVTELYKEQEDKREKKRARTRERDGRKLANGTTTPAT